MKKTLNIFIKSGINRNLIYMIILFSFLISGLELFSLGILVKFIIDIVNNNFIFNLGYFSFDTKEYYNYIFIFFGLFFILKSFLIFYFQVFIIKFIQNTQRIIMQKLLSLKIDPKIPFKLSNNSKSNLLQSIRINTEYFVDSYMTGLITFISESILIIFFSVYIFILNPFVFIVISIVTTIFLLFYILFFSKRIKILGGRTLDFSNSIIKIINIIYEGIREIKIFSLEKLINKDFQKFTDKYALNRISYSKILIIPKIIIELTIFLFIIISSYFLIDNNVLVNNLEFFLFISFSVIKLAPSVNKLLVSVSNINHGFYTVDNLYKFLNPSEKMSYQQIDTNNEYFTNYRIRNLQIKFDNNFVNKPINLDILTGDRIYIKGQSGSGKTSFFNVLCNLSQNYIGSVTLNNNDLPNMSDFISSNIAINNQKPYLLFNTLKDNIILDKEYDDKFYSSILEDLDLKYLDDKFKSIKNNILNINDYFSGGEMQKISLARVLYSKRSILFLDEPTSNIDSKTDLKIWTSLEKYFENKTVLFTSHNEIHSKYASKKYNIDRI